MRPKRRAAPKPRGDQAVGDGGRRVAVRPQLHTAQCTLDGSGHRAARRFRRDCRHHQLHEHVEPVGHDRRGPGREEGGGTGPAAPAVGEDQPGARLEGGDGLPRTRRPHAVPRSSSASTWSATAAPRASATAARCRRPSPQPSTTATSSSPPCSAATATSRAASTPTCARTTWPRRRSSWPTPLPGAWTSTRTTSPSARAATAAACS
jgi:hypothetical protein